MASEFLTAGLASVRWLDLLAADALQANRGFTRPSSPAFEQSPSQSFDGRGNDVANLDEQPFSDRSLTTSERYSWQLDKDIALKDFELSIFRNFIEHCALWVRHPFRCISSKC